MPFLSATRGHLHKYPKPLSLRKGKKLKKINRKHERLHKTQYPVMSTTRFVTLTMQNDKCSRFHPGTFKQEPK